MRLEHGSVQTNKTQERFDHENVHTCIIIIIMYVYALTLMCAFICSNYKEAIVYVASTLRNPETYQYFSQKIGT